MGIYIYEKWYELLLILQIYIGYIGVNMVSFPCSNSYFHISNIQIHPSIFHLPDIPGNDLLNRNADQIQ